MPDRQTGGQRVRRADLIFHCQLGQSSPSRPLSPDHIATYGQSPGLQTKPFSPDSRANVRWSQVEACSQLPPPGMAQSIREAVGSVCVQVPEAKLEYWLFLWLSVWKIIAKSISPPTRLVT